jgi:hypothetical protein
MKAVLHPHSVARGDQRFHRRCETAIIF